MKPDEVMLCFSAYSYYPIRYYDINITDFVGAKVSRRILGNCENVTQDNLPRECSPFNITVKAYSEVGGSNISSRNFSYPGIICIIIVVLN